jgi:hypothetical protein
MIMFTIHKRPQTRIGTDGVVREVPGETRTITTSMGLLRFALRERLFTHRTGGRPYPARPDNVHLGREGAPTYGLFDPLKRWEVTYDHVEAMRRAQRAYNERMHYRREVAPMWRPDTEYAGNESGVVHYADNSTVQYEIDKDGNRRHRTIIAPGGDACF